MFKRKIITAALLAIGALVSLEYTSVAQTNGGSTTSPGENTNPSGGGTMNAPSGTTTPPSDTTAPSGGTTSPGSTTDPSSGSTSSPSSTELSSSDKKFVLQAAEGGMAEVQMGQLATQKASSDVVKQYAQRMVDEHTQANNQLTTLAAQKGVTLPQELSSKYQSAYKKLSQLSGTAFDKAYMKTAGINAHKQQADLFKKEAEKGKDPDLKAFAAQILPTVQDHLQVARGITSGNTAGTNTNQQNQSTPEATPSPLPQSTTSPFPETTPSPLPQSTTSPLPGQ